MIKVGLGNLLSSLRKEQNVEHELSMLAHPVRPATLALAVKAADPVCRSGKCTLCRS